jgi:hypothetical protein
LLPLYPFALLGVALLYRHISAARKRNAVTTALAAVCAVALISQLFFQVNDRLSTSRTTNVFGIEHEYSARGYLARLPAELTRPANWVRLAAKRYPGLVAAPLVKSAGVSKRVATTDMDEYQRRYYRLPAAVYVQTSLLLALWLSAGAVVGLFHVRASAGAAAARANKAIR